MLLAEGKAAKEERQKRERAEREEKKMKKEEEEERDLQYVLPPPANESEYTPQEAADIGHDLLKCSKAKRAEIKERMISEKKVPVKMRALNTLIRKYGGPDKPRAFGWNKGKTSG